MAARKPHVGGNWKMNLTHARSAALAGAVVEGVGDCDAVDVTVFPPYPYLCKVGGIVRDARTRVKVGAQNFYFRGDGAFTGEVSLAMLEDVGASVVLVGHSERRHILGESDELVNEKVLAALDAGFDVVLCVGEKIEQREAGKTDAVNWAQLGYGLAGVKAEQMSRVTIAYEPVWAIGTGRTATPADAQQAHRAIRAFIQFGLFDADVATAVRIQYGGSVNPANAQQLFDQPDIDGGLIGGASLKPEEFLAIVKAAK